MASSSRPARARYLSSIVPTSLIPEKSGNHSECSSYFCWGPYRLVCCVPACIAGSGERQLGFDVVGDDGVDDVAVDPAVGHEVDAQPPDRCGSSRHSLRLVAGLAQHRLAAAAMNIDALLVHRPSSTSVV